MTHIHPVPERENWKKTFSISEVVEELAREGFKVTTQQIRKYEIQKLFTSIKKDSSSGYRVFETKDIERLRLILSLRLLGFSIANITKFIKLLDVYPLDNLDSKKISEIINKKDIDTIQDFIDECLHRSIKLTSILRKFMERLKELIELYKKEKQTSNMNK